MANDLSERTAADLATLFRSAEASPVEAAEATLDRIRQADGPINAFRLVDEDVTLTQARKSEARFAAGEPLGPLDGVPVAIKDVFLTAGWPTFKGSLTIDDSGPWDSDAPAVARLREAGAVFAGKTTTPEFGWKGVTDSPRDGVTRNPWDTSKTAGGSSGGSAAALAAGMVPLALGTDGGGSIRIPGGFTGVVGLKPTFARVPHWPMSPFGTLSHAGPMARTVTDTALLLQVLAGADHRDWTGLPVHGTDYVAETGGGVAGLRIAYSPDLGYVEVAPEIAASVEAAVTVLEREGATVEPIEGVFDDPREVFEILWYAAAAAIVTGLPEGVRDEIDPGLRQIADAGAAIGILDYMRAVQERVAIAVSLSELLDRFDLLVTPTLPIPAFDAGLEVPDGWPEPRWHTWTPFSLPFNLSQQPAATVPCGLTEDGLPVGLQIVGPRHGEVSVLSAASAYEAVRGGGDDLFVSPISS